MVGAGNAELAALAPILAMELNMSAMALVSCGCAGVLPKRLCNLLLRIQGAVRN